MACWVRAQESTSSCHKSYTLAPACGGGGLIRSLLGGRPPISAKQKRSSLSSTCPCCPLSSVSSKEPPAWAGVGWRVGWGTRRRVKLLKQEHRARRCRRMGTGCPPAAPETQRKWLSLEQEGWRSDVRMDLLMAAARQAAGVVTTAESGRLSLQGTIGALNPAGSWV